MSTQLNKLKPRDGKDSKVLLLEGFEHPKIFISTKAKAQMEQIVHQNSLEVGWLGVVKQEGNLYVLTEVMLFKQEVSATDCDINADTLTNFGMELINQPGGVEKFNSIRFWGHSHVDMDVSPSGTDESTMEMFAKSGNDYFIRAICNKKGEMKIDFFDYVKQVEFQNIAWSVIDTDENARHINIQIDELVKQLSELYESTEKEIEESIKAEIADKVTSKYKTSTNNNVTYLNNVYNGPYHGYDSGYDDWDDWDRFGSKKKDTDMIKEETSSTIYDDELFETIDDVFQYFNEDTIVEIGQMGHNEAKKFINETYANYFDEIDCYDIWYTCKEYVEELIEGSVE